MKTFTIKILLVSLLSIFAQAHAQNDDRETFNYELYGGFVFHTSGWGANLTYSKYRSESTRTIFQMDFYSIKDPKELKVRPSRSKNYVYGKLNSAYSFDVNFGRKKIISKDYKNKGVEVALKYTGGPTFLLLKPEYILINNPFSQTPTLERYNPEEHNLSNIQGGAPRLSGISETSFVPGVNAKIGLSFDFSPYKTYVRIIETGFMASYYISNVKIMNSPDERNFVPNLYVNFLFGRSNN
jgi:hypothetical protein